jgi:hypothetical protein
MQSNATFPGLLNLSAMFPANDNCVALTTVPAPRKPVKP